MKKKVSSGFRKCKYLCPVNIGTLFFILFFNPASNPQVPLNGFCKYSSQQITEGFTSIFAVNYNVDSYTDLLLFNKDKKQIANLEGSSSGKFEKQLSYDIPLELTKIARLSDKKNKTLGYAFSSRKGMSAGIFKLSKNGRPEQIKKVKFRSYPENICTADINKDGRNELMVSGGSFEGLAILTESKGTLQVNFIDANNSYTGAIFIDLTNDGSPDIAAYNLFLKTLIFFYNDGEGNYRKERSFAFSERIHSFKVFDLNLDSYQDLMFISGRSVYILYGDFRSSYEKKLVLHTGYVPDAYVIGDYNRDGRIDLAYLNRVNSIVSVLFAKDRQSFFGEIIMLRKPGISNLITFYSKFFNGIAVLSENGYLYTLSKISSISDDTEISAAAEPSVINFFDSEDDGIYDICFIDEFDNSLKLMIRNNAGIPAVLYSYPLFGNHSRIEVDDITPDKKSFYCYNPGSRLIEKINMDFYSNRFSREEIYSPGNVIDFKTERRDTSKFSIYILYEKNKNLGFSAFTKIDDFSFTEDYKNIANNVPDAAISGMNNAAFYFWKDSHDSLTLTKKTLPRKRRIIDPGETADVSQLISSKRLNIIQPFSKGRDIVNTFTGDIFNNGRDVSITFIILNAADSLKENMAIISSPGTLRVVRNQNLQVSSLNQIFFGEMRFNGLKKLFIYDPENKKLRKLDFLQGGNRWISSTIADAVNINYYFIKNMSFRNYHLVFTDKESGCISIRKIS